MTNGYERLLTEYPSVITLNQLYKICHISKRKGNWLLTNGIIPCIDTKKKTRRFKIKITDVVDFLNKRDMDALDIPTGIFSSKSQNAFFLYPQTLEIALSIRRYYENKFRKLPDGLRVREVSSVIGYSCSAINEWINTGVMQAYKRKVNLVPKVYLIDFVCGQYYSKIMKKSSIHRADMKSLLELQK